MAEFSALPLFTDAWIADTSHLTRAERGLYHDLIVLCWRSPECRVPNDIEWIARKLRCSADEIETLKAIISEFMQNTGNWLFQKRLKKEFIYVRSQSEKQSARAKSRWNKEKGISRGNAEPHDGGNAPTPTPTPTPIKGGGGGDAHAREASPVPEQVQESQAAILPDDAYALYDDVLKAAGLDRGQSIPAWWLPPTAALHIVRWRAYGLTDAEIIEIVRQAQKRFTDRPGSPRAFDHAIRAYAATKTMPPPPSLTNGGQSRVVVSKEAISAAIDAAFAEVRK